MGPKLKDAITFEVLLAPYGAGVSLPTYRSLNPTLKLILLRGIKPQK
jgi:hypothetical protein